VQKKEQSSDERSEKGQTVKMQSKDQKRNLKERISSEEMNKFNDPKLSHHHCATGLSRSLTYS